MKTISENRDQERITKIEESLKNLKHASELSSKVKEEIFNRTGEIEYPTGLTQLDNMLWGLHKKEVTVIGARTSMGKTVMAIHLAKELADANCTVLYLTLEMGAIQICERLVTNICEFNNIKLREGEDLYILEERISLFENWAKRVDLYIDDQSGYHIDKLFEAVKRCQPDFVIIDYIQMISTLEFNNKLHAIEDFVKEIKKMGEARNFGTILISQINREGVDRPYMHHLKHAGILEEHPDTVLLLHWDSFGGRYTIFVEKQRHGIVGKVEVKFEPQFNRFTDVEWRNFGKDKEIKG